MLLGGWEINVTKNAMPEKVATACAKLNEMVGAEYEPIAYLGSQSVNGINHAVLAEQTIVTGKDVKNAVIIIFNEKPSSLDPLTIVSIDTILKSGEGDGAINVDVKDITPEAQALFDEAFEGWVGVNLNPFALLGTQVVHGINYFYACELTPVTNEGKKSFAMIKINSATKSVDFTDDVGALSYAFTWLKNNKRATVKANNGCGDWSVNVDTSGVPQKVATAFGKLNEMVGASYTPIAYLGSQLVNGINHAMLAEQTLITKNPQKNIVVVIFNEPAGGSADDVFVVSINTIVEGGNGYGGVEINVEVNDNINKTAMKLFENKFTGFVGSVVKPFALLGTQIVRGTNFIFACEATPVIVGGEEEKKAVLVIINDFVDAIQFVNLLATPTTRVLNSPLGEWP